MWFHRKTNSGLNRSHEGLSLISCWQKSMVCFPGLPGGIADRPIPTAALPNDAKRRVPRLAPAGLC
jgi:hypothetical protein